MSPDQTRWDKAIRNLNNAIQVELANRADDKLAGDAIEKALRERLVPLLTALEIVWPHVWDNEFLKKDCEHTDYTRAMVTLRKERDKWL